MAEKIKDLLKKEAVAVIAVTAAVISCFLVPVINYARYVDTDVISLLFCLMTVVAGLKRGNVFKKITEAVTDTAGNCRRLTFLLVISAFFVSMLVTNDVALITFVPVTLMIYRELGRSPIFTVVLQTIAANMGSAFTPFGNPQNLYLFTRSGMSPEEFFGITAKPCIISLVMLILCMLPIKPEKINNIGTETVSLKEPKKLVMYSVLFVLCVLSVFGVIDRITLLTAVCAAVVIMQPAVFRDVDYGLLVTFAAFFIFVGNIKNVPQVTSFMERIIGNRELETAIILSQVISNVPAAVMLSGFTDNAHALIIGTDLGGLGTLIASLASLISFKAYAASEGADIKKYLGVFTGMNIVFLAVLYILCR